MTIFDLGPLYGHRMLDPRQVVTMETHRPTLAMDSIKAFMDHQLVVATAALDKEPADLSEAEFFAFCFLGGAEIAFDRETPESGRFFTKNPCGLRKINGKFQVVERRDQPGRLS